MVSCGHIASEIGLCGGGQKLEAILTQLVPKKIFICFRESCDDLVDFAIEHKASFHDRGRLIISG